MRAKGVKGQHDAALASRTHDTVGSCIAGVLAAAPALLWSASSAADNDWLSPSWTTFTGRATDALAGRGWLECVHPEDRERCLGIRSASFEACTPYSMDIRLRRHDGVYRWMVDSGVPRRAEASSRGESTAESATRAFVGSAMDIHERKVLEESLAERTQALRLAERRQSQFLGRLSHDLRNPLAPIANAASVLGTLERTNPILARLREIIERQVGRLGRLVEELVDVTRAAQGQISLVREQVSIDNLVRLAASDSQAQLAASGHRLDIVTVDADLAVRGDTTRLVQALDNLIGNAARFTLEPGVVSITVRKAAQTVHIGVKDAGIGIEPDFLPHIFELFAQGDPSLGCSVDGLGVGLTLARKIAQLHGGDVEAFSEGKGKGSEFILWLPLRGRVESTAAQPASRLGAPPVDRSHRVLVVEDEDDSLESMRLQLELWGNDVRTAGNAEEALAAAATHRPQLVLCDIGLPGIDGLVLVRELRKQLAGQSVLFAAVTGYASGDEKERAIAAGFDSFLVKPLEPNSLARLIRSVAKTGSI